jgi:hypothetical protein
MRWTSDTSGFVLRRMCELVGTGMRTDKRFKEVHVNKVDKALQEFTSEHVTGTQVYNHLCKWRQRWARVCKLRDLSGGTLECPHLQHQFGSGALPRSLQCNVALPSNLKFQSICFTTNSAALFVFL